MEQHFLNGVRMEIREDVLQGKAVLGSQGEDDGVLVRRRLQLSIEGAAETFAQGEPPGPVHPAAERSMQH